jgi:hypothetical protein
MAIRTAEELIVVDSNLDCKSVPSKMRVGTSGIVAVCVAVLTWANTGRIEMENVARPASRGRMGETSVKRDEPDFVALINEELSETIVWL